MTTVRCSSLIQHRRGAKNIECKFIVIQVCMTLNSCKPTLPLSFTHLSTIKRLYIFSLPFHIFLVDSNLTKRKSLHKPWGNILCLWWSLITCDIEHLTETFTIPSEMISIAFQIWQSSIKNQFPCHLLSHKLRSRPHIFH